MDKHELQTSTIQHAVCFSATRAVQRSIKRLLIITGLGLYSASLFALSTLPDINFYGRVIDQYGQPVANARVWQNGGSAYLRSGGGRGYAYTDENGYFELETRGAFLEIGGVGHPEIDYVNHPSQEQVILPFYIPVTRFATRPHNTSTDPDKLYYTDYKTKEKAFVIKAWRQQGYEGAKEGHSNLTFKADGRPYTLKLDRYGKRDYVETFRTEGETAGDFWVSCTRDAYVDGKRRTPGDWRLSITPVNGGIQETDDRYMNLAPETGYQPTLIIDMKKGARYYQAGFFNKRYYFHSNRQGQQQYGLLYVDIEPFVPGEDCGFDIKTFRYNPTGSRNLEMLREKPPEPVPATPEKKVFEFDDDF